MKGDSVKTLESQLIKSIDDYWLARSNIPDEIVERNKAILTDWLNSQGIPAINAFFREVCKVKRGEVHLSCNMIDDVAVPIIAETGQVIANVRGVDYSSSLDNYSDLTVKCFVGSKKEK